MSKAIEYLDILRRREPSLFQEGVRKSALTDNDIEEIEQALKYTLPASYKEFLQSYVMPQSCVINISLCGDLSVNFDEEGDDLYTNVEAAWLPENEQICAHFPAAIFHHSDFPRLYLRNSGMFTSLVTKVSTKNRTAVSTGSMMRFLMTRAGRIAMKALPFNTASHSVFRPQFTMAFVRNSAIKMRQSFTGFLYRIEP